MKRKDQYSIGCTVVCKLMPLYRQEVFLELSRQEDVRFTFLGGTREQEGIRTINPELAQQPNGINWIKIRSFFYKPELLLWQTGILKRIFTSGDRVFVFEGAVSHLPYWIFPLICRLAGKKVFFWTHGFRGTDTGIKRWIRTIFFKYLPHGLLLYGNRNKQLMVEAGLKESRQFVIYNSLISKKQLLQRRQVVATTEKKKEVFACPELFTVIFVGRLVPGKGVGLILETVINMKQEGPPINAVIIGSGPEEQMLRDYCVQHSLTGNVHFTGSVYEEEELACWFNCADLLLSPGNVGLNCIHALGYGVPVATHGDFRHQNPEVEAISEGVNGFFFERNNVSNLTEKLRSWIKNRNREEVRNVCMKVIADTYNSENQAELIKYVVNKWKK